MTEREFAFEVVRKLQSAGFTAYWAGGCVRDELLGIEPQDYDVATSARPEQLRGLFKRRNEIGAHFGVVQLIGPQDENGEWLTVEVATFRSDVSYTDGRRPDAVVYSSPEEDAKRRDFTINGMFFDPVANQLIDFVGGRFDLEARILRAIGNPVERFTEDKLRILRAVRIAARFDLTIDASTYSAAKAMVEAIHVVSVERITEELRKLLAHQTRGEAVRLLHEMGLLTLLLPELMTAESWQTNLRAVDSLDSVASFTLAFAALLHSVPLAALQAITARLRLSNAETDRILWLVENHAILEDAQSMRASRLYPILIQQGSIDLIALQRAIARACGAGLEHVEYLERLLRETPKAVLDPPPLVTGEDLKVMGLRPGPRFKLLLDDVREGQLDGRFQSKEEALAYLARLLEEQPPAPETPRA